MRVINKYSDEELAKLKRKDLAEYSKLWDKIKYRHLKSGYEWFDYACGGILVTSSSQNNYEQLDIYRSLFENSSQYKLMYLLHALELALDEAEDHLGKETFWIYEGLYKALKSKSETEWERYSIGFFVHTLVAFGAPKKRSMDIFSEWKGIADTKTRTAFLEYQKHSKEYPGHAGISFSGSKFKSIINESKRPFPEHDQKVFQAYKRVLEKIESDKIRDKHALELALSTIDKAFKK